MKQKGLRKLVSVILMVVMVLSMSAVAFAGENTITINNAVDGETYSAYKLFDLSYDSTNSAYTYTVAENWITFFTEGDGVQYVNLTNITGQGYVVNSITDGTALAAVISSYVSSSSIERNGYAVASEGTATITGLDSGYYFVDTSLGTLCSLGTTDDAKATTSINEKNPEPTVEKQVQEDSTGEWGSYNTAGVGETVYFKATISDAYNSSNLKFYDSMDSTLTYKNDVSVYLNSVDEDNLVNSNYYSVSTTTTGYTFVITFEDSYLATLSSENDLIVTYSATVTSSAAIYDNSNNNKAKITYGDAQISEESGTKTYLFDFTLNKVDATNNNTFLDGAEFTLKDSSNNTLYFTYDKATKTYTLDNSTTGDSKITVYDGSVTISGLDAGTYTLNETKAPTGYNLYTADITVVITDIANNNGTDIANVSMTQDGSSATTITVENNAGSVLPTTGGMGTTIFYIVGGVLVLGAAVLFVTKKRLGSEN